jgi:excisionase family DNA binding protein
MSAAEKLVVLTQGQLEILVRNALKAELDARREPAEVVDTEAAGELLHLDPKTVAKYAKAGKLPGHRLGSDWRFFRSELLKWLKEQGR